MLPVRARYLVPAHPACAEAGLRAKRNRNSADSTPFFAIEIG
jgi:hypothetical protein